LGAMTVRVGIEKVGVYPATLALDMRTLVEARGGDAALVCDDMMIQSRSLNPPWEDPVTLAVNACQDLLTQEEKDSVGLLLVGTESGPDQEKALSSWVRHYAGLRDDCRNLEVKHACYAGTGAVHLAAHWLLGQPDGARALVVCSDESRQHFHRPWEYVMGAGAVAMLLSRDPRFLALELDLGGVYAYEVSDLTRPTSRVEAGHSETSLLSYLDAVDLAFGRYREQAAARRGAHLCRLDQLREFMPYQVYHAPFGGITARAHRAMHRALDDFDPEACKSEFDSLVVPTLRHNRRMGGTYAASVYISLLGVVDAFGSDVLGRRVGIYSYGSGSCAEFFGGVFGPDAVEIARQANVGGRLDARRGVDVREYEEAERERSAFVDQGDFRTSLDGHGGWYQTRYAGRGLLTYRGADQHERLYQWS
jgi:3-hydroxy-3-methylglutaryl CoA synthase